MHCTFLTLGGETQVVNLDNVIVISEMEKDDHFHYDISFKDGTNLGLLGEIESREGLLLGSLKNTMNQHFLFPVKNIRMVSISNTKIVPVLGALLDCTIRSESGKIFYNIQVNAELLNLVFNRS